MASVPVEKLSESEAAEVEREQTDGFHLIIDALKLKGAVEIVPVGSLPKDGLVIEDQRKYD